MGIIFLINFLVSLAIFFLLSKGFVQNYKNKRIKKIINYLFVIGVLYFLVAMFSFLWFFDFLTYNSKDFMFIYALVILIQSLFLFQIIYLFSRNKKLFYFLFFYLISFLSFFTSVFNFLYLFLIISFLLTLLFFANLFFGLELYKKTATFGVFYSFISSTGNPFDVFYFYNELYFF